MGKEEIMGLLPSFDGEAENENKSELPYGILTVWAEAIKAKYKDQLMALIFEATVTNPNEPVKLLSYSFYIVAAIGRGFSYKLFELEFTDGNFYPCNVKSFTAASVSLGTASNAIELSEKIKALFSDSSVQKLLLSLVNEAKLYRLNNPKPEEKE